MGPPVIHVIYVILQNLSFKKQGPLVHGHIGSNQMNQNVEPKTFFQKGKSYYLAEIREC